MKMFKTDKSFKIMLSFKTDHYGSIVKPNDLLVDASKCYKGKKILSDDIGRAVTTTIPIYCYKIN